MSLDILTAYPEDSGVYNCKAVNKLGEAVTSASVRVIGQDFNETKQNSIFQKMRLIHKMYFFFNFSQESNHFGVSTS